MRVWSIYILYTGETVTFVPADDGATKRIESARNGETEAFRLNEALKRCEKTYMKVQIHVQKCVGQSTPVGARRLNVKTTRSTHSAQLCSLRPAVATTLLSFALAAMRLRFVVGWEWFAACCWVLFVVIASDSSPICDHNLWLDGQSVRRDVAERRTIKGEQIRWKKNVMVELATRQLWYIV